MRGPQSRVSDLAWRRVQDGRAWFAVAAVVVAWVFADTVVLRLHNFDSSLHGLHEDVTGHSIITARNWMREGLVGEHGMSFRAARHVTRPDLRSRLPYVTYPVGAFVPIYVLSSVLGREPTPAVAQGYALANHLAVALVLMALGWSLAAGARSLVRLVASVGPAVLWLNLRGPLWFMQNVWFADEAVILPFVLIALLETEYQFGARSSRLRWLISIVVFWGAFTDWLFVPVVLTLTVSRVSLARLRDEAPWRAALIDTARWVWLPAACAAAIFVAQLLSLGDWGVVENMVRRGLWRVNDGGLQRAESHLRDFTSQFWGHTLDWNFGEGGGVAFVVVVGGAAALLLAARRDWSRERDGRPWGASMHVLVLLTVPALLQLYVFRQHSVVHVFSGLKLAPVLALAGLGILPVLVGRRVSATWVVAISVAALLLTVERQREDYDRHCQSAPRAIRPRAEAVGGYARFDRVFFSPDFVIPVSPMRAVAFSTVEVRRFRHVEQLDEVRRRFPDADPVIVYVADRHEPFCEGARDIGAGLHACHYADVQRRAPVPQGGVR